jgi:hypothetical protein
MFQSGRIAAADISALTSFQILGTHNESSPDNRMP